MKTVIINCKACGQKTEFDEDELPMESEHRADRDIFTRLIFWIAATLISLFFSIAGCEVAVSREKTKRLEKALADPSVNVDYYDDHGRRFTRGTMPKKD